MTTTRMTDEKVRNKAITALGLRGFRAPVPTGDARANELATQAFEKRLKGMVESLRSQETAVAAREADAMQQEAERRAAADDHAKSAAHTSFLASNPNATVDDFERLWPALRDQQLLTQRDVAIEQARRSGRYSM